MGSSLAQRPLPRGPRRGRWVPSWERGRGRVKRDGGRARQPWIALTPTRSPVYRSRQDTCLCRCCAMAELSPTDDSAPPMPPPRDTTHRRLERHEADRVLKVAAELELAHEAEQSRLADGLTLAELKEIASDAGIPPQYVEQAAARVGYTIHGRSDSPPDDQSVACLVRDVSGHVAEYHRERIVEDIETTLGPGRVTMIGGSHDGPPDSEWSMVWSSGDSKEPQTLIFLRCKAAETSFFLSAQQDSSKADNAASVVGISAFIAGVFGASFLDFHIVLVILCGLLFGLVAGGVVFETVGRLTRGSRGVSTALQRLADQLASYPTVNVNDPIDA